MLPGIPSSRRYLQMPTYTDIKPRELKPALLELDGISRASIEAHYRLYQGYVASETRSSASSRPSTARARTRSTPSFARSRSSSASRSAGSRTTRSTSRTSAASGGDPTGAIDGLIRRDFGSVDAWRDDLKATGMAGRGWAWTAYDWDEHRLFNYIGDAQNTYPIWNATPLVALDTYEHAYFLDFQTDRGCLHRRVLREPRLGCRERLDRDLQHPGGVASRACSRTPSSSPGAI